MEKTCARTGKKFDVSEKEKALCERMKVPLPVLCPEERIRDVMATRNEWKLYRRKCDFSGDTIISAYDNDVPFPVYKNEVWWGDDWNALDFGRDFDFDRPFFEQFKELQQLVPREGTTVFNSQNCDYNSHIRESKNCYLCSLVYRCEDTHYSYWVVNDKDVCDSFLTNDSTLCYACCNVNKCYECVAVEEATNCTDCHFSYQLVGCKNCIFCSNLANQEYMILNKKCTQAEFEAKKVEILNGSFKDYEEAYAKFLAEVKGKATHRYVHNLNCENCTGDHIYDCKKCDNCYESFNAEDGFNSISLSGSRDAHNCYSAGWPACDMIYYSAVTRGSTDVAFCSYTFFSSSLRYCDSCNFCESCFGCIGLSHKKYCILNKQYSKEEYEELLPKIIAQMEGDEAWGKFFPPSTSVYSYNETSAQDYFPLTEKIATSVDWTWKEKNLADYRPASIDVVPDKVSDIDDDFVKEILACRDCAKNYKIQDFELKFYRKMNLPVPRDCPECRHGKRFKRKEPLALSQRKCDACGEGILSTFPSQGAGGQIHTAKLRVQGAGGQRHSAAPRVYCDKCYLQELY